MFKTIFTAAKFGNEIKYLYIKKLFRNNKTKL